MTNESPIKIKIKTKTFSHYFGCAGEETQRKPCVRWQKGPKNGYLLIPSCEGRVKTREISRLTDGMPLGRGSDWPFFLVRAIDCLDQRDDSLPIITSHRGRAVLEDRLKEILDLQ